MKIFLSVILGTPLLSIALSACADSPQEELPETPEAVVAEPTETVEPNQSEDTPFTVIKAETSSNIELSESEIAANAKFNSSGLDFFKLVCEEQPDKNIAVSPVSTGFALAMMANACDEEYSHGVNQYFGCDNLEALNILCNKLMMYLPHNSLGSEMSIANSTWHTPSLSPTENLIQQMNEKYYADVRPLDFTLPTAADTINKWVAVKTNDLIKDLVDPVSIYFADFITANALYFSGAWGIYFDKSKTAKDTFFGTANECTTDFMNTSPQLTYCKSALGQWVYLPYKGKHYHMILALPDESCDFDEFMQSFDASYLSPSYRKSWPEDVCVAYPRVYLSLPKFSISTSLTCGRHFEALGIHQHSKDIIGFTGPNTDKQKGFEIIHKTVMEIDEEGSKAASATANIMVSSPGNETPTPVEDIDLNFNRPFVFFICNSKTGSIIIAGKISQL